MSDISLVAFRVEVEHPALDYPSISSRFYADKGFEFREDGDWLWIWKGPHVIRVPISSVWYVIPTENPFNADSIRAASKAEFYGPPMPLSMPIAELARELEIQAKAESFLKVKPTIDQAFEVMAPKDDALDIRRAGKGPAK